MPAWQGSETRGQLEHLPRAREHYARAIALAPGIPEGHLMLARTYLLTSDDPTPGLRAAERARELLPGHAAVHLALARLYAVPHEGLPPYRDRARPRTTLRKRWTTGSWSSHAEASARAGSCWLGAPAKPSGIWLWSCGGRADSSMKWYS